MCATPLVLRTDSEAGADGDKPRLACPDGHWTHWDNPLPVLAALVEQDPGVEAAYLLDSQGIQVGGTHLGAICQQVPNRLFAPSHEGADHSTKEYFFSLLDTGLRRYTTDSYISMATGRLCRTIALRLEHQSGATYVLCLDIACGAEGGSARLRR